MNYSVVDGSKRSAMTSALLVLGMNGYRLETAQQELERIALWIGVERVSLDSIAE